MLMISTGELAASYAAVLDVSPPQSKFHHLDFRGQQEKCWKIIPQEFLSQVILK